MAFLFPRQPTLGAELGTGLGQGLTALAEQKLQQIQQRNMAQKLAKGLEQGYGYSPEQAQAFTQLPPELQKQAFKEQLAGGGDQAYAQALGLAPSSEKEGFSNPMKPLKGKQLTEVAKLNQRERLEAFKQTKAERKEFIDKARAAKQNLGDLNRLEELETQGEGLASAGLVEFLKRADLDIPALQGANAEEFNKLTTNFIKNAKSYYGSRVSNFELESFIKTIPSLTQSPEGRKRVIAQLKNIARLEEAAGKASKKIIKENGGVPPLDLYERVDDVLDKKATKFANKLRKDLARSVPAAQNKLLTAAGAIGGELLNKLKSPGTILGGLAGGYLGGPSGAAKGALTGAGIESALAKLLRGGG